MKPGLVRGAAAYSLSLAALMVGISTAGSFPGAPWLFLVGPAGLVGFVFRELRVFHPVLDPPLFRNMGSYPAVRLRPREAARTSRTFVHRISG